MLRTPLILTAALFGLSLAQTAAAEESAAFVARNAEIKERFEARRAEAIAERNDKETRDKTRVTSKHEPKRDSEG